MSDNDFDAELLALAGDDSASESEATRPIARASTSQSPEPPSGPATHLPRIGRAQKGVAQPKSKASRAGTAKRRSKDDSDEEGQASSVDSLGSGAMSESEDDAPAPKQAAVTEDGPLFPFEGRFYDEKDRAEIMALPELRREEILAERAAEVDKQRQKASLYGLKGTRVVTSAKAAESLKKRKAGAAELEDSPRKLNRAKVKAHENVDNYKRLRDQKNEQRRRNEENRKTGVDDPGDNDRFSDADAEGDRDSDVEWDEPARKVAPPKDEPLPDMRDYERIRVGRSNFAKVCFYPGFEDSMKGCFCRVNIGADKVTGQNIYRMTQIKGFTTGKPYAMEGPNGRPFHTDQYAIVVQGKAEKEWPFSACSDSRFTDGEYERYKRATTGDALRLPALSFLRTKCNGIHDLLNHRWTNEEIEEKLRRSGVLQMQNAPQNREALYRERDEAIADGNEATIARVDQELAALDGPKLAHSQPNGNGTTKSPAAKILSQQERLAALNRANRARNQEEIRKAQLAEKKAQKEAAAAVARGEAVANPFARVRTRAKFNFDVEDNTLKLPSSGGVDDLFGEASDISRAGTPAPGISTPTKKANGGPLKSGLGLAAKKKMNGDDLMAAMDFGIEIDI